METYNSAVQDFRRARSQAALQQLLSKLTGKSTELLSYEEVRRRLHASGVVSRTLREIPLDAIIGSVGRYSDFNRSFLPLQDSDEGRWARVKLATADLAGLPPVEVYQIGEAYFVHDGHHRISVARQLGADHIQAYVTEVRSKVPLSPDIEPKDLILSAEYAEFLDATHLDELRPDADLTVTCPGQYHKILEHIEVHRYYMGVEQQREIPYSEAVEHWYDRVYLPVVITMRELGVLNEFPKRSEADLYLWIADHRAAIEHELGWEIATSAAAADLADQHSPKWTRVASRLGRKVLNIMMPQPLESAAAAGSWRRERLKDALSERLFIDVLVALDGGESGWNALEQAVEVARREEGRLRAVHVVASEEALEEETVQAMRDRFYWRCGEVGLPGRFAVEVGSVSRSLAERARWTDLIVAGLNYPPGDKVVSKLSSGLRQLIRRSTRPVLSVPELKVGLQKALLAYDDSPRAREALFVASYAAGRWQMPLVVVHVAATMGEAQLVLQGAREYVASHGLEATYVPATGDVAEALVATAEAEGCDWIIAGGYEPNPVIDVVKGTALDGVLNLAKMPVLVCQ